MNRLQFYKGLESNFLSCDEKTNRIFCCWKSFAEKLAAEEVKKRYKPQLVHKSDLIPLEHKLANFSSKINDLKPEYFGKM